MKISLSPNQSSLEDQQQVLRSFMKIKPTLANLRGFAMFERLPQVMTGNIFRAW